MGRNVATIKTGRRPIHVVERVSQQDIGVLSTTIEITGNYTADRIRADNLKGINTYQSQLAARGIEKALEDRLPQGNYTVSGKSTGGQVTLTPYRR